MLGPSGHRNPKGAESGAKPGVPLIKTGLSASADVISSTDMFAFIDDCVSDAMMLISKSNSAPSSPRTEQTSPKSPSQAEKAPSTHARPAHRKHTKSSSYQ